MKREFIIVGVLLTFFLLSGLYYAATNSVTPDELTHITTGYINLRFNDYRFNIEHPPFVKQLAALPLLLIRLNFPFSIYQACVNPSNIVNIQEPFLFNMGNNIDLVLVLSRIPNIMISLLLGVFIYLYSQKLNGSFAGVISLALFVFSPSFLGHSSLVTMDTTVSCFYFVTIYFLMRFFETKENMPLVLTGIFLGLSLIAKFSALILIPAIYVLVSLYAFNFADQPSLRVPPLAGRSSLHKLRYFLFLLPLLPLVSSYKSSFKFIAPALFAFLFFNIFMKKAAISAKSRYACAILLIVLTIAFTFIIIDYTDFKWFPFHSATKAYFKGFSSFEGHAEGGQGASYLLGQWSAKGWWYYFPLAIFFKEPLLLPFFFIAGLVGMFMQNKNRLQSIVLLLPVIAYLFVSMFLNKVNIGIRHILPVYPFLFVMAGYSVVIIERYKFMAYILPVLLFILAADVVLAYPSHMSYFNRLIGGIDKGYKFLADSNIAWGQDWKRLKIYIEENGLREVKLAAVFTSTNNCDYYKIPYKRLKEEEMICPEAGCYIIETTMLAHDKIKWANKIKPSSRIGGSLLVYYISQKDVNAYRT